MLKRKNSDRVIIDTNLWISFLLTKDFSKLEILFKEKAVILFSDDLLEEFLEVAHRPKFKKYFAFRDLEYLLKQIKDYSEFITVLSETYICRDEKDNFLLSLALDGKASHLITGDKDLLVLQKMGETKILTITDYLSEL